MTTKRTGSAKKNLPYHNALILHKSKNLTVKDQLDFMGWYGCQRASGLIIQGEG
jgi:hypothetical protein